MANISKGFTDIDLSFKKNFFTSDISVIRNEDAIKRAVKNLILTKFGQRLYNSDIGTTIDSTLFANYGQAETLALEDGIKNVLDRYEPRINTKSVDVTFNEDTYELEVTIEYLILGIEAFLQDVTFILQPTRG